MILGGARDCSVPANARAQRRLSAPFTGFVASRSPQRRDSKFVFWPFGSCRGSNLPCYLSVALFQLLGAQPSGGPVFCRAAGSSAPPAPMFLGRAGDHPAPASARAPRGLSASLTGLAALRFPQRGNTKLASWPLGSCWGSNLPPLSLPCAFLDVGRPAP
ncbi:hypothetical protein NDU88_005446 [Pleurodeles waltl]|uniref:Uncharacterized protein n=1 Tax=Pleurodeles waltl TaxID=8319 RepID=A0AAV7QJ30_PLEWA|nr:hypothetical protein NDU88_005446 [Pleurodeles waltl]